MTDSENEGARRAAQRTWPQRVVSLARGPAGGRAFVVALVVGTALNLINQGDAALAGQVNWGKLALTYLVPFFVSLHGAGSAGRDQLPREPSDP